jgi:hypothetical protein
MVLGGGEEKQRGEIGGSARGRREGEVLGFIEAQTRWGLKEGSR